MDSQTQNESLPDSKVRRTLIAIFRGIPMTIGLVASLAAYCTLELLKYKLEMRRGSRIAALNSNESEDEFSKSLTNLAQAQQPSVPLTNSTSADAGVVSPDLATTNDHNREKVL